MEQNTSTANKRFFSKKNTLNIILISLMLLIVFVPSVKAYFIQGLMQIGLFTPTEQTKNATVPADLSKIVFADPKGNQVSLADLKGKIIFLNFWATWCPPCIAEMPSINKLAQAYKDDKDIVFMMVDADGDFSKSMDFMNKRQYNLPVYKAVSSVPEVIFGGSLPTTIVLDKQGRLSFREVGAANYNSKKFTNFIEKLKALKD